MPMQPDKAPEDAFPEKIRQLVLEGSYTVKAEEKSLTFESQFYEAYENLLEDFGMGFLPLSYNHAKGQFNLLPAFKARESTQRLSAYQNLFQDHYRKNYLGEEVLFLRDGYDMWGIEYRISNSSYAEKVLHESLGLSELDGMLDNYGWIENRKRIFYELLSDECDDHHLPKLPITFQTTDGMPAFVATQNEIENFIILLGRRKKISFLRQNEIDIYSAKSSKLDSSLSKEEKKLYIEKYENDMNKKISDLNDRFEQNCLEENKNYSFPSAILFYTNETAGSFAKNKNYSIEDEKAYVSEFRTQENNLLTDDFKEEKKENKYRLN